MTSAACTEGSAAIASAVCQRIVHPQTITRQLVRAHADIPSPAVEQVLHRDDESSRQQQHVEEQRADRCDAENAERGARRLPHEASPRKPERVHRRASLRPPRRRSAHDATTVAEAPSGTAIATQVSATSLVMRTKTSAVS